MTGILADDLTGAAELGAVGWRHGLRAEVLLTGEPSGDADLACLDTDSRSCAPGEAAERVTRAARVLRQQRAGWVYKKADSVLRGNVTPELEAIVSELALDGALLVPANPSLGRTIVGGHYFVPGQLIHDTEFARDPKHPRLSSDVRVLVAPPAALPLVVRRAEEGLPARGIVIGEVANADDVRKWAACKTDRWLMAGGAEFFRALLKLPRSRPQPEPPAGQELFVCGSASEATRIFVARQEAQGVRVFSLPPEVTAGRLLATAQLNRLVGEVVATLQSSERVILHVGLPPVRTRLQSLDHPQQPFSAGGDDEQRLSGFRQHAVFAWGSAALAFYRPVKNAGPHYVRGIEEGNGKPPGSHLWTTYSMNKEDIWVSRTRLPVTGTVSEHVQESFDSVESAARLELWNLYEPQWASIGVVNDPRQIGNKCLALRDEDPYDYALAERAFPEGSHVRIEFRVLAEKVGHGVLEAEVQDRHGHRPLKLRLDDRWLGQDQMSRRVNALPVPGRTWLAIRLDINCAVGTYDIALHGKTVGVGVKFAEPTASVERLVFRTGPYRGDVRAISVEGEHATLGFTSEDLPGADQRVSLSSYLIDDLKTSGPEIR
jgi:uncharacterized protein YgbK (DUF1537 family)